MTMANVETVVVHLEMEKLLVIGLSHILETIPPGLY